jgi:hypothetical protein
MAGLNIRTTKLVNRHIEEGNGYGESKSSTIPGRVYIREGRPWLTDAYQINDIDD